MAFCLVSSDNSAGSLPFLPYLSFQDNIGSGQATLDNQANQLKASVAPSRGYSPYNCCNTSYSRSHSEEHILSPCRDLIHKSSALFSPIRGTNPEMLSVTI